MKNSTKKYYGSGIIPILSIEGRKYIVLVKRTDDATVNPSMHSGFFGGVECSRPEEFDNPNLIASREISEEFFIVLQEGKFFYTLVIDGGYLKEQCDEFSKPIISLWNTEKGFKIKNEVVGSVATKITNEVDYAELDGLKKVLVVEFELPEDFLLLDGETKDEHPKPKGLLDRQIDLFDLVEFKKWWLGNESTALTACHSFIGACKIRRGFISRDKAKISPSLVLVLNGWLKIISCNDLA
jgi:hypothetical protein